MDITVKSKDGKHVFNYSAAEGSWYDFDHKVAKDINGGELGALELELIANGDVYGILKTGGNKICDVNIYDEDGNTVSDNYGIEDGATYIFEKCE